MSNDPSPYVVLIDSKPRLVAVARLAYVYGHKEAATVVRQLAEAVGVQCRGGRIYLPRRSGSVARGWARFTLNLSLGGRDELQLVVGRMVDRAVATGAYVTISPELAERIRATRVCRA